jgi:hypothetical protein
MTQEFRSAPGSEPDQDSNVAVAEPEAVSAAGKRSLPPTPIYRSVADGELKNTWTLSEYFASLNTVMRLPSKVRRRAEAVAKKTPGGETALALLDRVQIKTGWLIAGVGAFLLVLVGRPLLGAMSGGPEADLRAAVGVWEAGKGKYEGRSLQIVEKQIAFGTEPKTTRFAWHPIRSVHAKAAQDSTQYTVVYEQDGQAAEFAFWLVGGSPARIHVVHQPGVEWSKSPRTPTPPST